MRLERLNYLIIAISVLAIVSCKQPPPEEVVVYTPGVESLPNTRLFPTIFPDRIILNLTNDPTHSVAVNWRTDTLIMQSLIEVANATHGPEFIANSRQVGGQIERLTYQPENDLEVSAHYHSGIIDGLEPGEKYVYRVGSDTAWSFTDRRLLFL